MTLLSSGEVCLATGNFYKSSKGTPALTGRNTTLDTKLALQLPADGIELTFAQPQDVATFQLTDDEWEVLMQFRCNSIHAPWQWDDGRRIFYGAEDTPFMQKIGDIAARIRARHIVLHMFKPANLGMITDSLGIVSPRTILCIENTIKQYQLPFSLYRSILDMNPGMKLCLDTTHALTISPEELLGLLREFKTDIAYVHFSGNDSVTGARHKPFSLLTEDEQRLLNPVRRLSAPFGIETSSVHWMPNDPVVFFRNEIGAVRRWRSGTFG